MAAAVEDKISFNIHHKSKLMLLNFIALKSRVTDLKKEKLTACQGSCQVCPRVLPP